jgi:hypothetical protein
MADHLVTVDVIFTDRPLAVFGVIDDDVGRRHTTEAATDGELSKARAHADAPPDTPYVAG